MGKNEKKSEVVLVSEPDEDHPTGIAVILDREGWYIIGEYQILEEGQSVITATVAVTPEEFKKLSEIIEGVEDAKSRGEI